MPLSRDVDPAAALAKQALFAQVAGADDEEVAEKFALFGDQLVQERHAADFLVRGRRRCKPEMS
jgi:hypothetical protein